jgi:hypothetical protein
MVRSAQATSAQSTGITLRSGLAFHIRSSPRSIGLAATMSAIRPGSASAPAHGPAKGFGPAKGLGQLAGDAVPAGPIGQKGGIWSPRRPASSDIVVPPLPASRLSVARTRSLLPA